MSGLSHTGSRDSHIAWLVARDVAAHATASPHEAPADPRGAERELGDFAFRWVLAILQKMGAWREPGEAHDLAELVPRLGVVLKYHRYFAALVRKLEARGLVTLDGGVATATELVRGGALDRLDQIEEQVAELRESFRQRHPGCAGLLGFMVCCLGRFEEILTGRVDVADVLFQDGGMDVFAEVFRGDAVADHFNRLVAEAVRSAVVRQGRPGGPKIRILEIGAGTGGTTAAMLEALQPVAASAEVWFSDISPAFLRYARRRFSERYPWLEYRALNIEKDLAGQGFEPQSFDMVVAANVLHDTRDIEATLEQTRRLLRPGGLLVLNEFTAAKDCLFFSGALLHGYWLFEDPGRRLRDSCLLSVPLWSEALERTGFTLAASFALPAQSVSPERSQSVMLCAAPAAAAGAEEAREIVGRQLEQDILALLGDERSPAYSTRRPLMEMGLDSIELVELKSLVRGRFGVKLPAAFLFEHETQEKMTQALVSTLSDEQLHELMARELPVPVPGDALSAPPVMEAKGPAVEEDALAIVGMACRFSGGATSPEAFWKLLERGEHGIVSMPAGRWRWPDSVDLDGRHKGIDQGGFLERIDEFDARFFRTSPKEAELMDPQQRLLLELSWEALEDAGHRPSELAGRKVGVFVGVCQSDYRDVLVESADAAEGYVGSGTAFAMLSNRLSYFYDFKGPSLTVDTACSSSLFALHDAVHAIRRGECEQALVGAVNLLCSPTISLSYRQAGMLSPTGRCRTFDESADGYVRGEGGAVLVLKPLSLAIEQGDAIYGLVTGTAVSHGGQASTLTAPKPDSQAEVVEAAWRKAGSPPDSVGYIETHGTGTPLGDPIEISGLTAAFRRLYTAQGKGWPAASRHCGLGSVKTNLGHLEGAAGMAGLIKVLLSMQQGQIPRTLNFRRLNPEIDLDGSPFYIVERNHDWQRLLDGQGRELPRRASVSSFGFGGANAHAVVEEYLGDDAIEREERGPHLIPLSARTEDQLVERARRLLELVERLGRARPLRRTSPSPERALNGLTEILRRRFGLSDEGAPDLEWTELGWGVVETRLFLAAVEEAFGIRLPSRALIEHPSLQSLAERLARNLREVPPDREGRGRVRLADVAYTLQVGREPMEERAAFVVESQDDLAAALQGFIAGQRRQPEPAKAERKDGVEAGLAGRDLPSLASLWSRGAAVDWSRLHPAGGGPRRIHLPTYPFARERHWARRASPPRQPVAAQPVRRSLLPPVPPAGERPPATGAKIRLTASHYESLLTGEEFFLADHVIQGRRVLPAVAYLEMVREAVEQMANGRLAGGPPADRGGIWLKNVAWVRPLFLDRSAAQVSLVLTPDGEGRLSFAIYSSADGTEGEPVFHGQGHAGWSPAAAAPLVDLAAVRERCTRSVYSGEECYRAFAALGYEYGPAHRGIEALYVGADEILAKLALPPFLAGTWSELVLHPAMADAAVQSTIGFALAARKSADDAVQPALPFELRSAEVFKPCTAAMWAAIRRSDGSAGENEVGTFDIDLCDEAGSLCARFTGWTTRVLKGQLAPAVPAPAGERSGDLLLTPVWEPVPAGSEGFSRQAPAGPMAIVGGTGAQRAALQELHPEARPLALEPADDSERMRRKIAAWGEIGHIVWIVPEHRPASAGDESLITARQEGTVFCFRLIKALLQEGYGDKLLTWSVITTGTQAVQPEELADPAHAGVHGLLGSMAKEHIEWTVRLMDLPSAGAWPWKDLFSLAGDPHGNALAYRDGRWHRRRLLPCRPSGDNPGVYRAGGVYVVIGGAGGIGSLWSEALLRRLPVQIVWIGRRPKDAAIQARLEHLAGLGPAPLYIAADATDREQLLAARATIQREFGRIDGVIHAAMVVRDHSLANMTEDELCAGLSAKVDVCVRLAQVFGEDSLDFTLFFSSINSFSKWPGQSNYSAGCAFEDAFADRLAKEWPCPVRVINWGYWSVGDLATEKYRDSMARRGLGPIDPAEAMQVLDRLLSGPVRQLVYLAAVGPQALEGINVGAEEWAPGAIRAGDPGRSATAVAEAMGEPKEVAVGHLLSYLRLRVAETLGADAASLDSRARPFAGALLGEFGMDSLSSNSLRNLLRRELAVDLSVQQIIAEKAHRLVEALYEQLLLKHVSREPQPADGEETETFVF